MANSWTVLNSGSGSGGGGGQIGPFQRTLLLKNLEPKTDASDHCTVFANPGNPLRLRRVLLVLRKSITSDLVIRLNYIKPSGEIVMMGDFTLPHTQTPFSPAKVYTSGFYESA